MLGHDRLEELSATDFAPSQGESLEEMKHRLQSRFYRLFFHSSAVEGAMEERNAARYLGLLRLRDLTHFLEAYSASQDGDVGRLLYCYESWVVLFNGSRKVHQYSTLLVKLMLQLKSDLPPALRDVIRRGLLFSPSSRPLHCCAKDYYLETLNFWVKFFFKLNVRPITRSPQGCC